MVLDFKTLQSWDGFPKYLSRRFQESTVFPIPRNSWRNTADDTLCSYFDDTICGLWAFRKGGDKGMAQLASAICWPLPPTNPETQSSENAWWAIIGTAP